VAKFLLGLSERTTFLINKKCIQWGIDFTLPDEVRESMPSDEVIKLNGIFVMDFYSDPMVGDRITYKGHQWRIVGRQFAITMHQKREPKTVPTLVVEYEG
jgi:hypothetical protein